MTASQVSGQVCTAPPTLAVVWSQVGPVFLEEGAHRGQSAGAHSGYMQSRPAAGSKCVIQIQWCVCVCVWLQYKQDIFFSVHITIWTSVLLHVKKQCPQRFKEKKNNFKNNKIKSLLMCSITIYKSQVLWGRQAHPSAHVQQGGSNHWCLFH